MWHRVRQLKEFFVRFAGMKIRRNDHPQPHDMHNVSPPQPTYKWHCTRFSNHRTPTMVRLSGAALKEDGRMNTDQREGVGATTWVMNKEGTMRER